MLPQNYQWLLKEPGPKLLLEFLKIYGTLETPGKGNNPTILAWAKEVGVSAIYQHDETPWCGLAMALCAKRAGKPVVNNPLWALNWALWGEAVEAPELGDVLVFKRKTAQGTIAGHVGIYMLEKQLLPILSWVVIPGIRSRLPSLEKHRLFKARRFFHTGKPDNVRRITLDSSGHLSTNEQ
jgi:uncharacterized protein (TIGR02594 family)